MWWRWEGEGGERARSGNAGVRGVEQQKQNSQKKNPKDLIVRGLPAAGAAAGRALAVVLREDGIVPEWACDGDVECGSLAYGRA